jgi:hypothetical protein
MKTRKTRSRRITQNPGVFLLKAKHPGRQKTLVERKEYLRVDSNLLNPPWSMIGKGVQEEGLL